MRKAERENKEEARPDQNKYREIQRRRRSMTETKHRPERTNLDGVLLGKLAVLQGIRTVVRGVREKAMSVIVSVMVGQRNFFFDILSVVGQGTGLRVFVDKFDEGTRAGLGGRCCRKRV